MCLSPEKNDDKESLIKKDPDDKDILVKKLKTYSKYGFHVKNAGLILGILMVLYLLLLIRNVYVRAMKIQELDNMVEEAKQTVMQLYVLEAKILTTIRQLKRTFNHTEYTDLQVAQLL